MNAPLVEVTALGKVFRPTGFFGRARPNVALDEVTFSLAPGEFAALVGESGSGKTTLGRCLLGLLPFERGAARLAGFDIGALGRRDQKAFRRQAQMVFQNPHASLNPALRVGSSLAEAVRIHQDLRRGSVAAEVARLAELVRLPLALLRERPPRLSGGEKRRVAFARALATRPRFVVADEPVSGLDLPVQVSLLSLLHRIHARGHITFLLISHDLRVVRSLATRVLVLFRGRLLEDAAALDFFSGRALHPYSRELLESAFEMGKALRAPGATVHAPVAAGGCAFRHRCPAAAVDPGAPCATMPPALAQVSDQHWIACHRWKTATNKD